MLSTIWAVVREGKIEPLEPVELLEGSKVLVTLWEDDDSSFWWQDGQVNLRPLWQTPEEDADSPLSDK